MSPRLADGFFTTEPSDKPHFFHFVKFLSLFLLFLWLFTLPIFKVSLIMCIFSV